MKANASRDPQIITGVLNRSIRIGPVKKRRKSGKSITIGVHRKEEGAYYATPVEYGHGAPAPAPAHPFIRPAYDTRADEAYGIIRDGLRDAHRPTVTIGGIDHGNSYRIPAGRLDRGP